MAVSIIGAGAEAKLNRRLVDVLVRVASEPLKSDDPRERLSELGVKLAALVRLQQFGEEGFRGMLRVMTTESTPPSIQLAAIRTVESTAPQPRGGAHDIDTLLVLTVL